MSGQLLVQPTLATKQPHLRARLGLSNGIRLKKIRDEIRFIDQRTFGWLSVEQQSGGVPTCVAHIALDPFAKEFDIKQVISCLLYTSPSPRDRQKSRMPSSA